MVTNEFTPQQWERIERDYTAWWAGEMDRPLLHLTMYGCEPGRPAPAIPQPSNAHLYDPAIPAEEIVDAWDYNLCCQSLRGDGFPSVCPNLGPGVIAAFVGGQAEPREDTVWFHPAEALELSDLHLRLDRESPAFMRVADLLRAAVDRWQGRVLVTMTDLGGNLDIVSSFRPGEDLLLDLFDHPEEVKRTAWEGHEAWWDTYEALNGILQPLNPGYSTWTTMFSAVPFYMLQCDFAYMIGPDMFDEFVKPELAETCRKLGNAFYHLDGVGQLPHLDSLLSIPELKGIQWVPGAGQPGISAWLDVYARIRDAGKLVQVYGFGREGRESLDLLCEFLGSGRGITYIGNVGNEEETLQVLDEYGVPA